MPLVWETAGGGARRSSRVRNAESTTPAATQADADSATALESHAAEARLVEERRRRKEADRADAKEAEADDLSTRSADGTGCGAGAGSIAQRDACGAPPRPMAAAPFTATPPPQPTEQPPSAVTHLGTTSSKQQFFYSVLQPACKQVADDEDAWTEATFWPLLANEPSSAALALAEQCILVLHGAYAEGLKFPASEDGTARATFTARCECSGPIVALFPCFQQVYTSPLPEGLEVAWADLWSHVCGLFLVENGKPTVTVTAASEDTEQPPTERDERSRPPPHRSALLLALLRALFRTPSLTLLRLLPRVRRRIAGHLSGWAAYKVGIAVRRCKKDACFVPWLDKCCLPKGSTLPEDDPAYPYLEARMQFGGLTIPTPELVTAFQHAQHMLTLRLQDALARAGPERHQDNTIVTCYQRAVDQVYADAAVNTAFMHALGVLAKTRPAAAATAATANPAFASSAAPSMTILEYLLNLPAAQVKGLCVSIDASYWDWHGEPPPQREYGGRVTSWFSKSQGKEALYIEWELGRDDAGKAQRG